MLERTNCFPLFTRYLLRYINIFLSHFGGEIREWISCEKWRTGERNGAQTDGCARQLCKKCARLGGGGAARLGRGSDVRERDENGLNITE